MIAYRNFTRSRHVVINYTNRTSLLLWARKPILCHNESNVRRFVNIPTALLPPIVFGGLIVTLWTWKCMMMIVFQNKIIYMPGLPPNARKETIDHYRNQCGGINWTERKTIACDGTQISLCVAEVETGVDPMETVYILYFQGNASSLPSRLPYLSPILRMLRNASPEPVSIRYKMVCCSYRGYWTSKGRPSEKGIQKDAQAGLVWIQEDAKRYQAEENAHVASVVVWGQSIGAGFATQLVASPTNAPGQLPISTLILETPFLSIKSMLETLYPQKWLPYRYLSPFLRNHLDSSLALGKIAKTKKIMPKVVILDSGRDELVPKSHADELQSLCQSLRYHVTRYTVAGALHAEAIVRSEGRNQIVEAIQRSQSFTVDKR